jgi:hypothetical protein
MALYCRSSSWKLLQCKLLMLLSSFHCHQNEDSVLQFDCVFLLAADISPAFSGCALYLTGALPAMLQSHSKYRQELD